MYCETCPIRDYCKAYKEAREDNANSYYRQNIVRVVDYADPPCPLLEIVGKAKEE